MRMPAVLDEYVGSSSTQVVQVYRGANFQSLLKTFGADSAETISDINHLKNTTQVAGEEATETDIVPRNEEMTRGQRSTTVFVLHYQILFG
jgi:hypothetical protein